MAKWREEMWNEMAGSREMEVETMTNPSIKPGYVSVSTSTMRLSPRPHIPWLMLLVLMIISFATSFTSYSSIIGRISTTALSANASDGDRHHRRNKVFIIAASTVAVPLLCSLDFISITDRSPAPILPMIYPPAAHAIQAKNEALCNTGFFTNVGAWYCTDIGNIGDEGKPTPMSVNSESSVNSLMSKFNIDGVIIGDETTVGSRNGVRGEEDGKRKFGKRQTKSNGNRIDE